MLIVVWFPTLRREPGVSGQPVSILVEGVQVTLPSYEEAVSGGGGPPASASASESRVQIVLSEGQHTTGSEAGPSRPSSLKQQHSEMAVVRPAPLSSSSSSSPSPSSSNWVPEHAGAAAPLCSQSRSPAGSDQHSLALLDSEMDYSDGTSLFIPTFLTSLKVPLCNDADFLPLVYRYAVTEGGLRLAAAFGLH